ncbi:DUF4183 domain-containing protein [Paenibacillus sp. 203]|uniref:DUF4183 domain-containing protein n=1 Tax=Paenibacillus sp. 203 TaxID=3096765 RepID=UPI00300B8110
MIVVFQSRQTVLWFRLVSGYYNVFVNGTLQRGGLTTLSATNLIINTGLIVGAIVVIEVINFKSSASSTSVNNVTVTTTISD